MLRVPMPAMLMNAVVGRGDDGERALRGLHIDVHAVGEGHGHIDRAGRAAAIAFGDADVHGLDGLQFGQASHGGGDFRGQRFAFGIGSRGLGGVIIFSLLGGRRRNRDVDFLHCAQRDSGLSNSLVLPTTSTAS